MQTLNSLVVVMLDFHVWTGRKKLCPEDLEAVGNLPPDTLASLGSKKVADPKRVARFSALKKKAARACELVGVKFLSGYAIPEERLDDLLCEIKLIEVEYEEEKTQFLADYQQIVSDWVNENQQWGELILRAVESPSYIARQIRCGHQAFRIGAASVNDHEANAGLEDTVSGLGDRLIYEVSREAKQLWERSLQGNDKGSQKTLRPLKAILEKLRGLTFIDRRIDPLIFRIETGLVSIPKSGFIDGNDFNNLCGLVLQLSDPYNIRKAVDQPAQQEQDNESEEEPFDEDVAPPSPAVDAQENNPAVKTLEEELAVEETEEAPQDTVDAETVTDDDQDDNLEDVLVDDSSEYDQEMSDEDDFVLF